MSNITRMPCRYTRPALYQMSAEPRSYVWEKGEQEEEGIVNEGWREWGDGGGRVDIERATNQQKATKCLNQLFFQAVKSLLIV